MKLEKEMWTMGQMLKLSGIVLESIVDGLGIRMTVFTQGCPHHCEGCHNPQTHDYYAGYWADSDDLVMRYRENSLLKGITLSGGEPFLQGKSLASVCEAVRAAGGDVWAYSGFTFEQLTGTQAPEGARELLEQCDVLVDGKFVIEKRNLNLLFRGSENQRVIDVPRSLEAKAAIVLSMDDC